MPFPPRPGVFLAPPGWDLCRSRPDPGFFRLSPADPRLWRKRLECGRTGWDTRRELGSSCPRQGRASPAGSPPLRKSRIKDHPQPKPLLWDPSPPQSSGFGMRFIPFSELLLYAGEKNPQKTKFMGENSILMRSLPSDWDGVGVLVYGYGIIPDCKKIAKSKWDYPRLKKIGKNKIITGFKKIGESKQDYPR